MTLILHAALAMVPHYHRTDAELNACQQAHEQDLVRRANVLRNLTRA